MSGRASGWLRKFGNKVFPGARRGANPAPARSARERARPAVEALEARCLLTGQPLGDLGPVADPPPVPILANETVRAWIQQETSKLLAGFYAGGTFHNQWVVSLGAGRSPAESAAAVGAVNLGPTGHLPNTYLWQFNPAAAPAEVVGQLRGLEGVEVSYPLLSRAQTARFVPDDTLFPDQWHLENTGQSGGTSGADANLVPAWDLALGSGIVIAIVDDGLQYDHQDLMPNVWVNPGETDGNSTDDDLNGYVDDVHGYDFNDVDGDPYPDVASDSHGTAAAGVAAARGNNNEGVSGSAPNAQLIGLRLIAGPSSDQDEADALSYMRDVVHIYSNSWGPSDDGQNLTGPGALTLAALQDGVENGRGGLGNIFVWAAGNGLVNNDNANYDGYANSRFVIAVSAIDHDGVQSWYSEPGAPIFVAAYSSGDGAAITTTDVTGADGYSSGDYTNTFGGTSSATPLVAGVIALMLEVNPNLTYRDVQHILAETAVQNDPTDADWVINGGGFHVNHKYGFGAVDAFAAVQAAQTWTPVLAEDSTTNTQVVNEIIPDDDPGGVTSSLEITESLVVERVEVQFNATHDYRGDLRIILTSPDGTRSVLAESHDDAGVDYNWTFSSVRHWGEGSRGTWTL